MSKCSSFQSKRTEGTYKLSKCSRGKAAVVKLDAKQKGEMLLASSPSSCVRVRVCRSKTTHVPSVKTAHNVWYETHTCPEKCNLIHQLLPTSTTTTTITTITTQLLEYLVFIFALWIMISRGVEFLCWGVMLKGSNFEFYFWPDILSRVRSSFFVMVEESRLSISVKPCGRRYR